MNHWIIIVSLLSPGHVPHEYRDSSRFPTQEACEAELDGHGAPFATQRVLDSARFMSRGSTVLGLRCGRR